MSLDVDIVGIKSGRRYFTANITHNLNRMADHAGLYKALWLPEELGITTAGQLVPILEEGIATLKADPERYKKFNPSNGWGDYEGLVEFAEEYLVACQDLPDSPIRISR